MTASMTTSTVTRSTDIVDMAMIIIHTNEAMDMAMIIPNTAMVPGMDTVMVGRMASNMVASMEVLALATMVDLGSTSLIMAMAMALAMVTVVMAPVVTATVEAVVTVVTVVMVLVATAMAKNMAIRKAAVPSVVTQPRQSSFCLLFILFTKIRRGDDGLGLFFDDKAPTQDRLHLFNHDSSFSAVISVVW